MEQIVLDQLTPVRWKNGGGVTRELCIYPPHASLNDFIWRLSIAEITQSGAFSIFTGIERIIVLLEGTGMQLHFSNAPTYDLTTAHAPFRFSGEEIVHAELQGQTSTDFNLMLRRDAAHGEIEVWQCAATVSATGLVALYCASGEWQLHSDDGKPYHLKARQAIIQPPLNSDLIIDALSAHSVLYGVRVFLN